MKRLFAAAALGAAALVPASLAGAVPPGTSGGPLGSAACTVFGTPAPGVTSSCNFTGASGGLGYIGGSSGGFSLTHVVKVNKCVNGATTADVQGTVKTDASGGAGPFNAGPGYNFVPGRVYTFAIIGYGWGAVGGNSTPTPTAPSEPATPSAANNYAGAENGTVAVGTPC